MIKHEVVVESESVAIRVSRPVGKVGSGEKPEQIEQEAVLESLAMQEVSKRELQILLLVYQESIALGKTVAELTKTQIVDRTGIPVNYVSFHLKALLNKGVITSTDEPNGYSLSLPSPTL